MLQSVSKVFMLSLCSGAVVYWIDIFTRDEYFNLITESLNYCIKEKGLILHAYCIMPSHVHMIFRDKNNNPSKLLKEFKTFTSKKLKQAIEGNIQESRKEWVLWMMKRAASKNSNVKLYQFWQQNNQPIELWSVEVIDQKLDYIHNNPILSGFVNEPEHWKYSSAIDYAGGKGLVKINNING